MKEFSHNKINGKTRENNIIEYIEKLNLKSESKVINNPFKKFNLYKSNPIKQFIFSLFSELNSLEELFISNFIKETKRKTENEVRELFPQKKKEYKDRIELILEKAKKELMINNDVINNLKQKNLELKKELETLKNQNIVINTEIKESDLSIKQLNEKFKVYSKFKEIYDHVSSGFNHKEKEDIENNILDLKKEFNKNKNLLSEVGKELKEKKNQIYELKQKIVNEETHNRNSNYKLYNEFFEIEKNNKIIEDKDKKKLLSIKEDINSNKSCIQEHEKIQKSFISLFNLFYNDLNLERNIIKNPNNIDLIKSDYSPKTFIIEEVVNYITLMLQNSTDESCFNLLKDIVSYINMILREIGGGLNKKKYDPIVSVNEIEKYFKSIQKENENLTESIKTIENKIIQENILIKKLNEQIKNIKNIQEEIKNEINNIYINNKKERMIKKSLSANILKISDNIKNIKENKKPIKFDDTKKIFEMKNEEEKIPYYKESLEILMNRINSLYFYEINDRKYKRKNLDIYEKAHRRINRKLNKLKLIQKHDGNYFTVENTITNNINRNIENLIFNIQKKYK